MSDLDLFVKTRASELSAELNVAEKKKNNVRRKQVMKKIIANITMSNHDMINLFPEILKLFSHDDIELKRMCYRFINLYSIAKPEIATHAIPIIQSDLRSENIALVSLALLSLTSVPLEEFSSKAIKPIKTFLDHNDPEYRKIAVYSIAKLLELNLSLARDNRLVDDLIYLIDDPHPKVATAALSVLNDLTDNNDKFKLNISLNQALHFIDFLSKSDEWQQISILNALMNFVPQTHEDAHILIDKVIPFFQHKNTGVILNGFKLLLYLFNYVDYIEGYLTRKLAVSLSSLLSKPAELQFLVLRNVILLILSKPNLIPFDVSLFFCDYKDPIYVKDTKLEIIYLLANESNLETVLSELQQYSTGVDMQMSRKSIRAIGNLAVKIESSSKDCVETLLDLISFGVEYVVQESLIVFKNILRRYDTFNYVVPKLLEHIETVEDPDSKASLIWIVGNFAEQIKDPQFILETLTNDFQNDALEVQLTSLTAAAKLFLKQPHKGESLVLKLLKIATEQIDNPDVRDRGFFYWGLLSVQNKFPDTAKSIICGEIPPISNENEQLDPLILQELELNMGTLASIYLKPVGEVFRLAKRKYVPDSPARSNESSRLSTAKSKLSSVVDHDNISSSASSDNFASHSEKHIEDFDVPAVNVKPIKQKSNLSSGLSRKLTISKTSLTRRLSIKPSSK